MASVKIRKNVPLPHSPAIERHRLLDKLQLALQSRLTLVSAPPGYGKTTLVADFARHTPYSVIWHSVEERERDVSNLHAHSQAVWSEMLPNVGDLTPQPHSTPSEWVVHLTEHIRRAVVEDVVYILDDTHHLLGSPGGEAWLQTLVARLPPCCHVVLISRTIPRLPLTEMVARREVLGIGYDELRFTLEEVRELAEKANSQLSNPELGEITTRLEGWPAGIILALQPLPNNLETAVFQGQDGPETLFNTLAEQMLNSQPPALKDFLLQSSTLRHMTPELCQKVLALAYGLDWFSQGLTHNLFLTRVSGSLVYHPLFRAFLQQQLCLNQPDLFLNLHTLAGQWFEHNNQIDDAFEHYITAQQWEKAVAIAERVARDYFSQGKVETVLHWREQLKAAPHSTPKLDYVCAMAYTDRYQYDLARGSLEEAAVGFQMSRDEMGLWQVQLLQATIDNQSGNYQEAVHRIEPLMQHSTLPDNLRGYALTTLGMSQLQLGDETAALQHLEAALPLYRSVGDTYATSQLLQHLELAYIRLGQFDEAATCLQEVVALRRSLGSAIGLAVALNDLGYHYHQSGEYKQALVTFQEGLSVISSVPEKRAESTLLWSMGDLQRDRGGFEEASQLYAKAMELVGDHEPALRCGLLTSLSTLYRWQGKLQAAESLALQAFSLADQHSISVERVKADVALWAARAQQGQVSEARQHLNQLADELFRRKAAARLAQTWGICAHAALLASDMSAATQYLKHIAQNVTHPGNLHLLIVEIHHTPALKTLLAHQLTDYTLILEGLKRLEKAQIRAVTPTSFSLQAISQLPFRLQVWALGQERVERDESLISPSAWRATTARHLFFYLLFVGPRQKEQIGLDYWPDYSPQQVRGNFHATLHRTREALGENVIVFENDQYLINPDVDVMCDVYEFEALVQQARLMPPRAAHTEDTWRRAVNLYKGEFLPSLDAEWIDARREALQELYLEALLGLGNSIRCRHNPQEAIPILKRALQLDPYREDAHRAIIRCYLEQGERPRALKHFDELKRLLRRELAVAPSRETLALVNSLLQ